MCGLVPLSKMKNRPFIICWLVPIHLGGWYFAVWVRANFLLKDSHVSCSMAHLTHFRWCCWLVPFVQIDVQTSTVLVIILVIKSVIHNFCIIGLLMFVLDLYHHFGRKALIHIFCMTCLLIVVDVCAGFRHVSSF